MPEFAQNNWAYTVPDREFYEPFERLRPTEADFIDLIRRILPDDWRTDRRSIWFHCRREGAVVPSQGWKIHLSTALATSAQLLVTVVPILIANGTPFKCTIDRYVLRLLQSKGWSRGGAGKFMTIYPRDEDDCRRLLERLHAATIGFSGQYILSDRRYRDSQVVHYRYGGFHPTRRLHVEGETISVIRSVDGQSIDDDRTPYFNLPAGIVDPFSDPSAVEDSGEAGTLKQGRYQITSAFGFGNAGGIYLATDRMTGDTVVIKEARPVTNQSPRVGDAIVMLKKEHRMLTMLSGTGVAPEAIDFFKDWEHYYLVEEYIRGETFRDYVRQHSRLAMKTRPSVADVEEFRTSFRWIFQRIVDVVVTLHAHRIVFGDISYNNVMIGEDGSVRMIDFEGAHELDVDSPAPFFTAGFAPRQKIEDNGGTLEDDWFGVGALMLNTMLPMTPLLGLHPEACDRFLDSFIADFGLPASLATNIRALMHPERSARGGPTVARAAYDLPLAASEPVLRTDAVDAEDWSALRQDLLAYVDAKADFSRDDRLFPCSPDAFRTNALGVAYGACGIAYAQQRIRGRVDQRVVEWIGSRPISREDVPPGLYVGMGGIAWTLLELGWRERAEKIMAMTFDHPLRYESPDLYFGASGLGMSLLRFFVETGDEAYLEHARQAGAFLLQSRMREDGRSWWPIAGREFSGLGHGPAGVALFLLYLYRATGDDAWLAAGHEALAHVLARAQYMSDGVQSWRIQESDPTVTPYWRWGNAGIGMVLLRYDRATGDGRYKDTIATLAVDVARKYSIFPSLHSGLAGMADFLIDLAAFADDPACARDAVRLPLSGLLHFKIPRPEGIAFPGDDRQRITCDFANGNAGIAYVIDRFLRGGTPAFMLDDLLGTSLTNRAAHGGAAFRPALPQPDALQPA